MIPAAVLYAGFTLFTLVATRQQIPVQSCGCFGREDTPPSYIHVVYNAVASLSLFWVALTESTPILTDGMPVETLLFVVFALAGAYASYLLLGRLPQVLRATVSS